MRKCFAVIFAAILLSVASAFADSFLDDFNLYASEVYNIPQLQPLVENTSYKSDEVEVLISDDIEIYGEDALSVITAACCSLRVIDNAGSQIDHYGKLLHAYFLYRSSGEESRATTATGIEIYFSEAADIYSVRLVK